MYLRRVCMLRYGGIFANFGQKCHGLVSVPCVVREGSVTFHCRTRTMDYFRNIVPEGHTFYSTSISNHKLVCECQEKSIKSSSLCENNCEKNNFYLTNEHKEKQTHRRHSTFIAPMLSMIPHAMTSYKIGNNFHQERCCRFYCTSAEKDDNDPDYELLAKSVIEAARKINVLAGSIQIAKVVTLLKELHSRQIPLVPMQEILSQNLQMLQEAEDMVKITDLLISHGLNQDVVVNILRTLPLNEGDISFKSLETLFNNSLHHLRQMGFLENYINLLLALEPNILLVNPEILNSVFTKLKGLFTTVDAIRMIQHSPNILSDPWVETNEKFDYAYFTMGYKQEDILRSHLFGHTLEHIRDRHIFLVRAGIFYPVKEKDDPRLNPNPLLKSVIDTSNDVFAESFGGMSEEEFETYLLMRKEEREDEASDEMEEEEQQLKAKSRKNTKK